MDDALVIALGIETVDFLPNGPARRGDAAFVRHAGARHYRFVPAFGPSARNFLD
jgi:hypothetical protein